MTRFRAMSGTHTCWFLCLWVTKSLFVKRHYYKQLYFSKLEIIQMSATWEGMKKPRGYFSAANRNEPQIHITTWIHLRNVILSEKSQTQKGTYPIIPFIWSFRNDRTNLMVTEPRILDVRSGGCEHKERLEMRHVGALWGVRNVLSLNRKTG